MNWDHNLYAVDTQTGEVRWRQRTGHYFAFNPQPQGAGVAAEGYDLKSAEGYHLYLLGADGKPQRRFALYGLPVACRTASSRGPSSRTTSTTSPSPRMGAAASAGDLGWPVVARRQPSLVPRLVEDGPPHRRSGGLVPKRCCRLRE
jgi:hypothetical protein